MAKKTVQLEAIGTKWRIDTHGGLRDSDWTKLVQDITVRISAFDKTYSRFRSDSWVTTLSQKADTYLLPSDTYPMLDFYQKLYEATEGKVTPLIGQAMVDAGYDAAYSFEPKRPVQPPKFEDVLSFTKQNLTMSKPALLDFGAAGKGYLVDIIATILERAGVQSYTINAGGDIRHRVPNNEPLLVGLENPQNVSEAIGVAKIHNQSLCASSGSKRQWGNYHHIIDPETLSSPDRISASWVIADDTMTADGLATALFFVSPKKLQEQFSFEYAILESDMALTYSQNFPVKPFEALHASHR